MIKLNERTIFFSHHLVVEPLLNGSMSSCEPAAVLSLQLQADGLLLGGNDVLPGGGLLLHALLSLDLREKGGSSKHFLRHQNGDKSKI